MIPGLNNKSRSVLMPNKQIDDFPSELKEQLTEGSQQIFLAAFNSAQEDGMSEEGALSVAWNTVKHDYEQGEDGKWQRRPQQSNSQYKSVTSGGN
jgi:cation transport regulator